MVLMLYTGAARADAVQLGWANVVDNRIQYRRQKMKSRGGVLIDIPIHKDLRRRLEGVSQEQETFLQTRFGRERSANGLGVLMRDWCDAVIDEDDNPVLDECTPHGLRKACARRLAESGATPHEIMAVTGHKTLSEVERYTQKASRSGLADRAMNKFYDASE